MNWFWWLAKPLFWYVRTQVVPENPVSWLNLRSDRPVVYVLPLRSLSDLLILYHHCLKLNLPLPTLSLRQLGAIRGGAAYLYLGRLGILQPLRPTDRTNPSAPLVELVKLVEEKLQEDVQLVPVSILWGRDPGREELSIFKLLFADDEHAGILQRFFIVIAQGRNVFVKFGKAISLRELVDEGAGPEQTARKLRRVLRVHFRKERNNALGPKLADRSQIMETLIATRPIQAAIDQETRSSGAKRQKVERKARYYIREIAAEPTPSTIRLFDIVLTWLWNKVFDGLVVRNTERLHHLPSDAEIIYVPTHRSHFDYLLIGYALYHAGITTPHTFAGINLNFWPIGGMFRKIGAFYVRRTFRGNRLYTSVFNEYIHYLLTKGHSIKFFPEGGRSRTGRLLAPKTGMMAMIVHSYLRDSSRPYVLMPVSIGYDTVMEVKTYVHELRGSSKRKESIGQLLKARKVLGAQYGKVYIGFGEPIYLNQVLDQMHPQWRDERSGSELKPAWMAPVVSKLAGSVMENINAATVCSPVAFFAVILLANPQRAMTEPDLLMVFEILRRLIDESKYCPDICVPEGDPKKLLLSVERVAPVRRLQDPGGDVIYLGENDGILLSYYRNNILHLFAMPSLIASFFQHRDTMPQATIMATCQKMYPFLKPEFFLPWSNAELTSVVEKYIDIMVRSGLLIRQGDELQRPEVVSEKFVALKLLGVALGHVFQRYSISVTLLASASRDGAVIERADYESRCQQMAQRVSLLNGVNDIEFYDRALFKNYIEMLAAEGYLEFKNGGLQAATKLPAFAELLSNLLSPDVQQSVKRISAQTETLP